MKKWLFLLMLVMLLLPFAVRLNHNFSLAGSEPYFHSRLALSFLDGFPEADAGVVGSRDYFWNPYHFFLAAAVWISGRFAFFYVPVFFAVASFFIFDLLLQFFRVDLATRLFALAVFALSSPLIGVAFLNTPRAFILFFVLLSVFLTLKNRPFSAGVSFVVASCSGGVISVLVVLFFLALSGWGKKECLFAAAFAVLLAYGFGFSGLLLPSTGYFSDFGAVYGFSLFGFLLACMGAVMVWKSTRKILYLLIVAVFLLPSSIFVANVLVAYFAGLALNWLYSRQWHLAFIRNATLLVLFCGLLFSCLAHATFLARLPPSEDLFEVLELPEGVVFTHEKYGFWVEFAGHKVLTDSFSDNSVLLRSDSEKLFSSAELGGAERLIGKHNISYVLLSEEMRDGLVWERAGQGLDFLVENSEKFKRLGYTEDFIVWKYDES